MEVGHCYPPFVSLVPFWPSGQTFTVWEKPFNPFISTPPRRFSNRTSPPTECDSLDCPVKARHHRYEYWHRGKQPHKEDWEAFHGSNPPSNVWVSYNRLQCHRGCGSMADIKRVGEFRRHHGCKTDDLQWRSQEKAWEMGIIAEGDASPPERKEKSKPTGQHQRVIRAVDYLQPGDKSPYHEYRMRRLEHRKRQQDRMYNLVLRKPPNSPKEPPKGKWGRRFRSVVNFLESI